jgi:hypothetical protein
MLRDAVERYIRATEEGAEAAVRGGLFAGMKRALEQSAPETATPGENISVEWDPEYGPQLIDRKD